MTATITCDHVSMTIKGEEILSSISCTFEENKIYGLLGRNGAGKTTFMKLLTGQLLPTSGSIRLNGEDPFNNEKAQMHLCFIKESGNFLKGLTVNQLMKNIPSFFPNWDHQLVDELLDRFELPRHKRISTLSKGMESALGITVGLGSRAPVTIFDEPYIGMDAANRQLFYDRLVEDYAEHPRTIIISTHLIDEIASVFERITVIRKGKMIVDQEVDSLRNHAFKLTGKEDDFDFLQGVQILDEQRFMGKRTLTVLDEHGTLQSIPASIQKQPLSLQDFMVQVTK